MPKYSKIKQNYNPVKVHNVLVRNTKSTALIMKVDDPYFSYLILQQANSVSSKCLKNSELEIQVDEESFTWEVVLTKRILVKKKCIDQSKNDRRELDKFFNISFLYMKSGR